MIKLNKIITYYIGFHLENLINLFAFNKNNLLIHLSKVSKTYVSQNTKELAKGN